MRPEGSLLSSALVALLLPGVAAAGGYSPEPGAVVDPAAVAALAVLDDAGPTGNSRFAWGGRFVGDLDGDGTDDIALPAESGDRVVLVFGDPSWSSSDPTVRSSGDATLLLPDGCRDSEGRLRVTGLGDLDRDGKDDLGVACGGTQVDLGDQTANGAVALYFGRSGAWGSDAPPDLLLPGEPLNNVADPPTGEVFGVRLEAAGDLDGDGRDDFLVTGHHPADSDISMLWIFHGRLDARTAWSSSADATFWLHGNEGARCLTTLEPAGIGDLDADGLADFALFCGAQPPPTQANDISLTMSLFLGADLVNEPVGQLQFADRTMPWDLLQGITPGPAPFSNLGDLDDSPGDEFGIGLWEPQTGAPGARIIRSGPGPWDEIDPLEGGPDNLPYPYTFFLLEDGYDSREGVQMAPAGAPRGTPAIWLRHGRGADARVSLLEVIDPSLWAEFEEPATGPSFGTPGGLVYDDDWRLGLGGPGDADGDGVPDLLITGGHDDGDCTAGTCGGAWLVLCRDEDGDGDNACGGDCDDADASRGPSLAEACDAIDHDCDGVPGTDDADGDGFAPCAGDCDDADPDVFPGAVETCDGTADANCDRLLPGDDEDGDLTINCEDCQPFLITVHPAADEVCDGLDTDCDGRLPELEQDIDRDGFRACSEASGRPVDCDDRNPFIRPLRFEDCANGIDDNCNQQVDESRDGDGDGVASCDGDCDDTAADVFPGAGEACDGRDNDCDGLVDDGRDRDGDGFSHCQGDCDDLDPTRFPGATGVCDGSDADCDGASDLLDGDADGFSACAGDCADGDDTIHPAATEFCDRLDNDCDGSVDTPFDLDADTWAGCLGDCEDGDAALFPQRWEPDCADGLDGDCDGTLDGLDSDCPAPVEPPPPDPRPLGLTCDDAGASMAGRAGLLLALLVVPLRRRRVSLNRGVPVALVLLAALVLPNSASAARKEPGVVVYLSRLPDLRSMTESTRIADMVQAEEVLHHSELLDSVDPPGLVAEGARTLDRCPEDSPAAQPLSLTSGQALDRMIELDHAGAKRILDAALDSLPCLDRPLPQGVLPDLLYYRGISNLELGKQGEAEDDFAACLAVKPDYPGDPNFPPDWAAVLEQVRAGAPVGRASVSAVLPPGSELRIDGVTHDADTLPVELPPGRHVVQLRRGRDLATGVVDLVEGSAPLLLHSEDRVRAFREAQLGGAARAFSERVLGLAAMDAGVDVVAVVDFDVPNQPLRYLYRPSIGAFSFEDAFDTRGGRSSRPARTAPARAPKNKPARTAASTPGTQTRPANSGGGTRPASTGAPVRQARAAVAPSDDLGADHVRIRVSGGFAWAHPFPYLHIPIDITIRPIAGLGIDVGLEAARSGPSAYGAAWLPSASLGAGWRFDAGVVQPRLAVVGRLAFDNGAGKVAPVPGITGRVGLDFVPRGAGPLLFAIDLQAGAIRRSFHGIATAGVGLRF